MFSKQFFNSMLFILQFCIYVYLIFIYVTFIENNNIAYNNYKTIYRNCYNICVIFCLALNYKWNNVKYFILSLNRTSYNGHVILLVEENSTLISMRLSLNFNISFIFVTRRYPYISKNNIHYNIDINKANTVMIKFHKFSFTVYRHIIIKLWLDEYLYLFKYYALIDIRDVIFQSNPFCVKLKKGVYLFEEAINYPIKYQTKMVEWIRVYNNWEGISDNPIINSGLTIGTKYEFYKFYNIYIKLLINSSTASQGTLNYYYYSGFFNSIPIHLFRNGYGLALHFHVEYIDKNNSEHFFPPLNNVFRNKDYSIPSIIHQYDRIGWNNMKFYLRNITLENCS